MLETKWKSPLVHYMNSKIRDLKIGDHYETIRVLYLETYLILSHVESNQTYGRVSNKHKEFM